MRGRRGLRRRHPSCPARRRIRRTGRRAPRVRARRCGAPRRRPPRRAPRPTPRRGALGRRGFAGREARDLGFARLAEHDDERHQRGRQAARRPGTGPSAAGGGGAGRVRRRESLGHRCSSRAAKPGLISGAVARMSLTRSSSSRRSWSTVSPASARSSASSSRAPRGSGIHAGAWQAFLSFVTARWTRVPALVSLVPSTAASSAFDSPPWNFRATSSRSRGRAWRARCGRWCGGPRGPPPPRARARLVGQVADQRRRALALAQLVERRVARDPEQPAAPAAAPLVEVARRR